MAKAITNPGKTPMYVAGRYIGPGETRHFEDHEVPPHMLEEAINTETSRHNPSATTPQASSEKAADLIARLASLSVEQLLELEQQEHDGKKRKGVLEAIAKELLTRAADDENINPQLQADLEIFKFDLSQMNEDELQEQIEAFKEDEGRLAIVQAEIDQRKAASNG